MASSPAAGEVESPLPPLLPQRRPATARPCCTALAACLWVALKWVTVYPARWCALWLVYGPFEWACRRRRCVYVDMVGGEVREREFPVDGLPRPPPSTVRVVCISDTHDRLGWVDVPPGDVLVHAGDVTMLGGWGDCSAAWAGRQLRALPHAHKVVIGGNHDACLAAAGPEHAAALLGAGITYLECSGARVPVTGADGGTRSLSVWGVPHTPRSRSPNSAWQERAGTAALAASFSTIPRGLDILVTHTPPEFCAELYAVTVRTARPRLVVSGHIHDAAGAARAPYEGGVWINAAVVGGGCWYLPRNPAIVYDLPLPPP